MRELEQWLCWRSEERGGKETKIPYSPRSGRMASSTDPGTWATLAEARRARKERDYSGIGFVFTEADAYVGVDLDSCRDLESGELEEWAREIVALLDSYTEVSPSGTGLHIICKGELPPGRSRKGSVEAYSSARYFTMTGEHLEDTPQTVEERTQELRELARRVFGEPSTNGSGADHTGGHRASEGILEDEELIERASNADDGGKFADLWAGGYYGLASHSEAVAALLMKLAFWSGRDAEQMERIFRRSGLMYEKFDSRRGDTTWGAQEIEKAIEKVGEVYTPPASRRTFGAGGRNAGGHATGSNTQMPWPELDEAAFYGLPGDVVRAVEPHSEADPAAVLMNLLCGFGNAAGRGAFVRAGADFHHLKLNAALVGETSKGRKGTSYGPVRGLLHAADGSWVEDRVLSGLSSGEGLIHAVRDRIEGENKKGEEVVLDEGVKDKRLLIMEAELAGVLKVMAREGNTLSPVIRQAWDGDRLQTLTKNNPTRATGAHVSIIGHITKDELLRHLADTEAANGFANRFLWVLVRRSKELPFGGEWYTTDTRALAERLESALEFAGQPVEITWGEDAREVWRGVYGPLSEGKGGLFGAVVGRGEAQALRLAALYAALDESTTIEEVHIMAALAVWSYAEDSARYIFGDATGDPVADQVMEALRTAGEDGMSRTELRDLFGRNRTAERINGALALLLRVGRVRREREETGGRPTERWFLK